MVNEIDDKIVKTSEPEIIETQPREDRAMKPVNFIKVGTVNIYNQLPHFIKKPLHKRYHKFYRRVEMILIIDLILVLIVLGFIGLFIYVIKEKQQWLGGLINNQINLEIKPDVKVVAKLLSPNEPIIENGNEVKLKIQLINNSKTDFENPVISLDVQGNNINYKLAETDLNLPRDQFAKNEMIEKEITLKDVTVSDRKISIIVILQVKEAEIIRSFVSTPLVIKIISQVNFSSQSKYYTVDGEQLGLGPLPPKVGEATSYWLFWKIKNGFSNLKDVQIEGELPQGIMFTGKTSVTEGAGVSHQANKIIWNIGNLTSDSTAQAAFEVEIIPSSNQIGQSPMLLTNQQFTATDEYSNKMIQKTVAPLTTALTDLSLDSNLSKVTK